MIKVAVRVLTIAALATLATPLLGEDDFPLVGTYTENQACKGDGSDSGVSRVKITARDIDSVFGLCTILSRKREGATFTVHVECKGPDGRQVLGDRARTRPTSVSVERIRSLTNWFRRERRPIAPRDAKITVIIARSLMICVWSPCARGRS